MDFKEVATKAALEAGKFILEKQKHMGKITSKGHADILTEADLGSEKIIVDLIKKNFPKHSILSEEMGAEDNSSEYTWIIDPLDGTIFFSRGIPLFSVSIALKHKKEIILGVVYAPITNELFTAEKGKGAQLNGKKISVSNKAFSESFIAVDYRPKEEQIKAAMNFVENSAKKAFFVRTFACEVLELAYVACGRFEANVTFMTKPWDVAAGILLIEEAGGKVTNFEGNKFDIEKKELYLTASNGKIHKELLELI